MLKFKTARKLFVTLIFGISSYYSKQAEVAILTNDKKTIKFINKKELFTYKKNSFDNEHDLIVNIQKDLELLEKFLRFYGFFDAQIKYNIKQDKNEDIVEFIINEGTRYRLKKITFNNPINFNHSQFIGKKFDIKYTDEIEKQILDSLFANGFSNAKVLKINLQHDNQTKTVSINVIFDPGVKQKFGTTTFRGFYNIPREKISKFISWKEGEIFSPSKLDTFRIKISELNFFSDINVYTIEDNNTQNVFVDVIEDKKYTIECGLKFTTARNINYKNRGIRKMKGLIMHAKWTNNIVGKQCDKLSLSAEGMPFYEKHKIVNSINRDIAPDYHFRAELIKNELFKKKYSHRIYGEYSQIWFNKYIKHGVLTGYSLSQYKRSEYNDYYKISYENYKLTTFSPENTKNSTEETFNFINLEYTFDIDKRNNFNDPSEGFRAIYTVTPELCLNKSSHILSLDALHSFYSPLNHKSNIIVIWSRLKGLLTPHKSHIPADKMVYAGGAKSIRGYYMDFAGEVKNDIPTGGKSSLELGIELRKKFSKTWGGCLFVEGARVHDDVFPSHGKFYNAYGFGVRYYSSFGPIRIDIGFPFRKRDKTDAFAQVYISLGHRF